MSDRRPLQALAGLLVTFAFLAAGCNSSEQTEHVGPTEDEVNALAAQMTPAFCAEVSAREEALADKDPQSHAKAWAELAPHAPDTGLRDHIEAVVRGLERSGAGAETGSTSHVSTGALATAANNECEVEIGSVGVIDNR